MFRKCNKTNVKNCLIEEYEVPKNLDLLNKWTIPKIQPKVLYELGTFEELGFVQSVKTTEENLTMNQNEITLKLLSYNDINRYQTHYNYLHIGLVQIAFKPLTLQGLPESFLAVLRDARNRNWKQSLMGIIQTSLTNGPVYFNVYPNLQLSLSDVNILDALTLNVKTHGYNYVPGSELICICYRIYFRPLVSMNPRCKRTNMSINETILIESNFDMSKITTRKAIKWSEIEFPENWILEGAIPPQPVVNNKITNIVQTSDGIVNIEFEKEKPEIEENSLIRRSRSQRTSYSYISPIDYRVEIPSRASTSQIREDIDEKIEHLNIKNNIVQGIYQNEDPTPSEMNFNL